MRKFVLIAVLATFTSGIVGCGDSSAPASGSEGPKPPGVPTSGPEAPKAPKTSKAAKKH
ncbi:hypothetical protein [Paludisphaera borealis]|uniref:Uncharacterized protein n=1 Tax=Paludisphaera borealis TaxID=1387353 RepID=A0A1U7CTU3_9BACT|nr:hypothetical protein [Paludisphaera borealis]APW62319.1 hypothetical protein BSF38_03858 [Paludisphaera borealis]